VGGVRSEADACEGCAQEVFDFGVQAGEPGVRTCSFPEVPADHADVCSSDAAVPSAFVGLGDTARPAKELLGA